MNLNPPVPGEREVGEDLWTQAGREQLYLCPVLSPGQEEAEEDLPAQQRVRSAAQFADAPDKVTRFHSDGVAEAEVRRIQGERPSEKGLEDRKRCRPWNMEVG